jgi:hypothetical protein
MLDDALARALAALHAAAQCRPPGCLWPEGAVPLDGLPPSVSRGTVQRLAREGLVEVATTEAWAHPGPVPARKLRWMNPATPEAKAWMGDWNAIWDWIDQNGECPYMLRLTLEGAEAVAPPQAELPERVSVDEIGDRAGIGDDAIRIIAREAGLPTRRKGQGYTRDEIARMIEVDAIKGKVSDNAIRNFRSTMKQWLRL